MNERIKELAEQAGMQHKVMLDDSSRDIDVFVTKYNGSVPSLQNWEKFAELIVKECINLCNSEDDSWVKIAKHFGVEE